MVCAWTGLPPGLLMRSTTPWVLLSLNAACSAVVTFSALASVPGAIRPLTSTIAVCFLPPVTSARPFQSTAIIRIRVMYANVSSLKKMPHSRARRCSLSAAVASLVTSSRSHCPLFSFICKPHEVDLAVAFLDGELDQRSAVAGSAEAAAARRVVRRAVRRAYQVASARIEKYSFLPVEFHRDVRAAVQVAVDAPGVAHR